MVKFLTAGTFSKIKGQDILAAAIRMLPDEYMKKLNSVSVAMKLQLMKKCTQVYVNWKRL